MWGAERDVRDLNPIVETVTRLGGWLGPAVLRLIGSPKEERANGRK